jgi:Cu/Ag efflux protein CusF
MKAFTKSLIGSVLILILAVQSAAADSTGCKHHAAPQTSSSSSDKQFNYTIKGIIKALPGDGRAKNEILVKHEAIPDYRDEGGELVGMAAMTMPFYISDKISLAEFKVGDKIEMVLEQRIGVKFSEEVISIKRLAD